MKTINSLLKSKKRLKNYAEQNGKTLVYNRSLGGYQIISGFKSSAVEYPARTKSNKLVLAINQLSRLYKVIK
jgi:hypothetical protein